MRPHLHLWLLVLLAADAALAQAPELALRDIQRSHIEGNVPAAQDFDAFLQRDVATYFQTAKGMRNPEVVVELLRKGATQSGVAFPKFYAWVVVKIEGKEVEEGALRVAAINRVRFEVTNFLSKGDIKLKPTVVATIFPAPLVSGILERSSR